MSVPTSRPRLQNGRTPSRLTTNSSTHCAASSTTAPAVADSSISATETIEANSPAMATLAPRYAPAGIGNARFSSSSPRSRSSASDTPSPNSPGAMTPKMVNLASICPATPPAADGGPSMTANSR